MFTAGVAGLSVIAASVRTGLQPATEIWLSAALVVVVILHARMGFALTKAQAEIEMLRRLTSRYRNRDEDGDAPKSAKPSKSAASSAQADATSLAPVFSIDSADDLSEEDTKMLERVRDAIEGGRVDLYLQPIVSLPQRKVRYYEAFSRLRDAQGRILRPTDYLEAAERANRIGDIDNLILLRSVQAFRKLRVREHQLAVFCNISPATLFDTEFFNQFTDYLELNADLSTRLVFEFTYPAIHMMHPRFEENLKSIAKRGYAFSIDHVPSLDLDWEALREKNFRFVKAPSSLLLAAGGGDEVAATRLRTFRKRISDAGIDLIAEKIEFESHMPEVLSLGIDYGQGNLFGPPRPAEFYVVKDNQEADSLAQAS